MKAAGDTVADLIRRAESSGDSGKAAAGIAAQASGAIRPNKLYFWCFNCEGKVFAARPRLDRRAGASPDPDDLVECPFCGAHEGEPMLVDGTPVASPATGKPLLALRQVKNSMEKSNWDRAYAVQRKVLPIRTAPGQFIQLPTTYMRDVFPKLTHVQRSLVQVLLLFKDGSTGYSAVGLRKLAAYCTPGNRGTEMDLKTIRDALAGMERIEVDVYDLATKTSERRPFLRSRQSGRNPTLYWIEFPRLEGAR